MVSRRRQPITARYIRLGAKGLLESAAGFTIALIAGANVSAAAGALAWGMLWFGGSWGIAIAVLTVAVGVNAKRKEPEKEARDSTLAAGFRRNAAARLVEVILASWRGNVLFLMALVLLALSDPLLTALAAGAPLGIAFIGLPLVAAANYAVRRAKTPTGNEST